jgi:hypothetical protein
MNFGPDDKDADLIARYRQASQAQGATPSASAREAILAEGRRIAAERAELAQHPFDTKQPAANQPRWKLAAYGSLGAALFAVVLMLPRFWDPKRSELLVLTTESQRVAQPTAPATSGPGPTPAAPAAAEPRAPTAESLAPPSAAKQSRRQAPALQSIQRPSPANGAASPRADASLNELNAVTQTSRSEGLVAPAAPPNYTSAPAPLANAQASARFGAAAPSLAAAVTSGDAGRLTQLLDRGLSPQQADSSGRTPLLLAVIAKRQDMVQLLLARGADPNAADPAGETPLQRARRDHLPSIVAMLEAAGAH